MESKYQVPEASRGPRGRIQSKRPLGAQNAMSTVVALECDNYDKEHVVSVIRAAVSHIGGIERFVPAGSTVLIKPNLLSPCHPKEAITTHPSIIAAIIRLCLEAKAKRVWIGDSCAGNHADDKLWEATGTADAVRQEGGELKSFQPPIISVPCGDTALPVPAWWDEVDVFISVPKLKTHILTSVTCSLKNVYGLVSGGAKALFHRRYPSPLTMSSFLVDVHAALRPALSIVDAVMAMEGDGPANGTPVNTGLILASDDAAALDACCASAYGFTWKDVPMIRMAHERGLGRVKPEEIEILGDGLSRLRRAQLRPAHGRFLQKLPDSLFRCVSSAARFRLRIVEPDCVRCGICAETCAQGAISPSPGGTFQIDDNKCILCMCCMESCPKHAVIIHAPLDALRRQIKSLFHR